MTTFIEHFHSSMSDTITIVPGVNDWEGAFVASGATFAPRCHVVALARRVRDESGVETVSTHQIYLDDNYNLNTRDYRFTLPARFEPRTLLQAIAIRKHADEDGPSYEVVILP